MIEIGKQYLLKTKEQLIKEYGISYNGTPNVIYGINRFNINVRSFYTRYKLHITNPERYDINYLTKVVSQ